jgi:hypothetical protein
LIGEHANGGDVGRTPDLRIGATSEQAFTAAIQNTLSARISEEVGNLALSEERAAIGFGCHPALAMFSWADYLSPPKTMRRCVAAPEFAVASVVEASMRIFYNERGNVSEQWMIDCTDNSCEGGGWIDEDLRLLSEYGGVSEQSSPYLDKDGVCNLATPKAFRITNWGYVDKAGGVPNSAAMKEALCAYGPLVVGMRVTPLFSRYIGGVFQQHTEKSEAKVNHAVVLFGWDDGNEAWLVRNSWGEDWGIEGDAMVRFESNNLGFGAAWLRAVPVQASEFEKTARESAKVRDAFETELTDEYRKIEGIPDNVIKRSLESYLGVR